MSADQKRADYESIMGPRPMSSANPELTPKEVSDGQIHWDQNLEKFRGLCEPPVIEGLFRLEDFKRAMPDFIEYGLGDRAIFYRMAVRGVEDDLWVSFTGRTMPYAASKPGHLYFFEEILTRTGVLRDEFIRDQQQWLISEGECVPKMHPTHGAPDVTRNAENCQA